MNLGFENHKVDVEQSEIRTYSDGVAASNLPGLQESDIQSNMSRSGIEDSYFDASYSQAEEMEMDVELASPNERVMGTVLAPPEEATMAETPDGVIRSELPIYFNDEPDDLDAEFDSVPMTQDNENGFECQATFQSLGNGQTSERRQYFDLILYVHWLIQTLDDFYKLLEKLAGLLFGPESYRFQGPPKVRFYFTDIDYEKKRWNYELEFGDETGLDESLAPEVRKKSMKTPSLIYTFGALSLQCYGKRQSNFELNTDLKNLLNQYKNPVPQKRPTTCEIWERILKIEI